MKTEAEKLPFTNENLKQLIVACLDAEFAFNENGKQPLKKEPEIPVKANIAKYNDYVTKVSNWKSEIAEIQQKYDMLKADFELKKSELLNFIPTWNIWFLTDCGQYAAAIKMRNWGGTQTELLFTNDTSDLQNLKPS